MGRSLDSFLIRVEMLRDGERPGCKSVLPNFFHVLLRCRVDARCNFCVDDIAAQVVASGVSRWKCLSGITSPHSPSPPQSTEPRRLLRPDRRQIGATFSATSPAQPTQPLITRATRRTRTIRALLHIVLLFRAEQTLLLLDAFAVDAAATNGTVETAESSARAADAAARGEAVDAGVLWVRGGCACEAGDCV